METSRYEYFNHHLVEDEQIYRFWVFLRKALFAFGEKGGKLRESFLNSFGLRRRGKHKGVNLLSHIY